MAIDSSSVVVLALYCLSVFCVHRPVKLPILLPRKVKRIFNCCSCCHSDMDSEESQSVFERTYLTLDYATAPLLGALVLAVSPLISLSDVLNALVDSLRILILFFGLAYLTLSWDATGIFELLGRRAIRAVERERSSVRVEDRPYSRSCSSDNSGGDANEGAEETTDTVMDGRKAMIALVMFASALTIVTSNDIVILTTTPLVAAVVSDSGVNPGGGSACKLSAEEERQAWRTARAARAIVFAVFYTANVWSLALLIGNPTNIIIGQAAKITFVEYSRVMLLPTVAGGFTCFVTLVLMYFFVLRRISGDLKSARSVVPAGRSTAVSPSLSPSDNSLPRARHNPRSDDDSVGEPESNCSSPVLSLLRHSTEHAPPSSMSSDLTSDTFALWMDGTRAGAQVVVDPSTNLNIVEHKGLDATNHSLDGKPLDVGEFVAHEAALLLQALSSQATLSAESVLHDKIGAICSGLLFLVCVLLVAIGSWTHWPMPAIIGGCAGVAVCWDAGRDLFYLCAIARAPSAVAAASAAAASGYGPVINELSIPRTEQPDPLSKPPERAIFERLNAVDSIADVSIDRSEVADVRSLPPVFSPLSYGTEVISSVVPIPHVDVRAAAASSNIAHALESDIKQTDNMKQLDSESVIIADDISPADIDVAVAVLLTAAVTDRQLADGGATSMPVLRSSTSQDFNRRTGATVALAIAESQPQITTSDPEIAAPRPSGTSHCAGCSRLVGPWIERHFPTVYCVVGRCPWKVLPFLCSMYVFVEAMALHGWLEVLTSVFVSVSKLSNESPLGVSFFFVMIGTLSAGLLNNQPMAVLFARALTHSSMVFELTKDTRQRAIYGSIVGSNLGACISLSGALAGLMCVQILRLKGIKVSAVEFSWQGSIVAVTTATTFALVLSLVI